MPFPTFNELAKSVLTYKRPSEKDMIRHAKALVLIEELSDTLISTPQGSYQDVSLAIDRFVGLLMETTHPDTNFSVIDGSRAFPEGTEVVRILSRVRMCANRSIGAKSVTGGSDDWKLQLCMELRNLELAVATAIVATPLD